mmetsp:Transcript_12839/g.16767  ORF Transcript_12839/g.16767 Transcript_12839/m.16767 type:complete len:263 (-) Transcript_12839:952-1740(-)
MITEIIHHSHLPESDPHRVFPPPPPVHEPVLPMRQTIKIALVGDAKSGKTSIARRFMKHDLCSSSCEYHPTIGPEYMRLDMQLSNQICVRLQLWDIPDRCCLPDLLGKKVRPDGVIIVCEPNVSIVEPNMELERSVRKWCEYVCSETRQGVYELSIPISIFVNKVERQRLVDFASGKVMLMGKQMERLSIELGYDGSLSWYVTSAKDNEFISEGFHSMIKHILRSRGLTFTDDNKDLTKNECTRTTDVTTQRNGSFSFCLIS